MSVRDDFEKMQEDAKFGKAIRSGEASMFKNDEGVQMVVMPRDTFLDMTDEIDFLDALRAAGVDNWEGYSEAHRLLEEGEF